LAADLGVARLATPDAPEALGQHAEQQPQQDAEQQWYGPHKSHHPFSYNLEILGSAVGYHTTGWFVFKGSLAGP
jgi:hypothetical protein